MNENINLCELLKGHEGETFYSPAYGDIELNNISPINTYCLCFNFGETCIYLKKDGKYIDDGECIIFPSKEQRDWNKWSKEQKPKVPKTWDEYVKLDYIDNLPSIARYNRESGEDEIPFDEELYPIEKSALALIKIHQLIEVGYGGNVTQEEWADTSTSKYGIVINNCINKDILTDIVKYWVRINPIAFHTKEQAKEFISYPENVQLLIDFNMI